MVVIAVHIRNAPFAADYLSSARLSKAEALAKPDDRARSLCAGLALDACLRTVGLSEREVTVATDAQGKPYCSSHPQWHFSLSHSGEFAVCALDEAPLGVDIEQYRKVNAEKLADRCYGAEPTQTVEEFFNSWTRQESYVKAIGVGLAGMRKQPENGWHFRRYPFPGYSLTVCSQSESITPSISLFSYDGTVPPR
ncbi:MAG: 4'-phosphopantetheinyl transferase superfamily protein [Clostridia bacterium]|nr:4'-phosphopantetheinyl transferase superfamily protein [Clostridia bacterium]